MGKMMCSHSTKRRGCHPDPTVPYTEPTFSLLWRGNRRDESKGHGTQACRSTGEAESGSRTTLAMMQFDSNLKVFMVFKPLWEEKHVKQGAKGEDCWERGGRQVPLRFPGRALERQGETEGSLFGSELSSVLPSSRCKWDWTVNVPQL